MVQNRDSSVTLRLNPHPSRTEGRGTWKFNDDHLGGVEG
jgi:hypothetical protein